MTRLMLRVADAREAAQAAVSGVDAIELCMVTPRPATLDEAGAVRRAFPGTLRLRFGGSNVTSEIAETAATLRAEEIALDAVAPPIPIGDVALPVGLRTIAMIASGPDQLEAIEHVRGRVGGVMLDTADAARLIDRSGISRLDAFASACEAAGLPFGLAGGLEAPDVARLLLLRPDVLGFDTAVRIGHQRDGALDPKALDAIRALIPRDGAMVGSQQATHKPAVTDRIFVRDFVSLLSIGAYQAEHAIRQRVRFSVEADVLREPVEPRDMRDVFSYDVIIETIRVLSQRAHVTFVETLAEEIAASLLTHAELAMVIVKVEKLDVIDGAVGIEIVRRRGG